MVLAPTAPGEPPRSAKSVVSDKASGPDAAGGSADDTQRTPKHATKRAISVIPAEYILFCQVSMPNPPKTQSKIGPSRKSWSPRRELKNAYANQRFSTNSAD